MTQLLHIDASARGLDHASNTRRLSARFLVRWRAARPSDVIVYRDVGQCPPAHADAAFIEAAFTRPARRTPAMQRAIAQSDRLVDELLASDLIIAGVPMYNFGVPAQFKAYLDNVVRVGRTFGFDRARPDDPYQPLLAGMGKTLVIASSRGHNGYDPGGHNAMNNHVEPAIRSVFHFLGVQDVRCVAVEHDEFGDDTFRASLDHAEQRLDAIVDQLLAAKACEALSAPRREELQVNA